MTNATTILTNAEIEAILAADYTEVKPTTAKYFPEFLDSIQELEQEMADEVAYTGNIITFPSVSVAEADDDLMLA